MIIENSNYLDKYTNKVKKTSNKEKSSKIKIYDDEDYFDNQNKLNLEETNSHEKEIWREIQEEENEDELNAIRQAVNENQISNVENEKLILNKRKRHDSDSEIDELINHPEEGLIVEMKLNKESKSNNKLQLLEKEREILKKQTVYRDEKGRKVDKSETKLMQRKELEKTNYENLSKWGKGIIQKEEKERKKQELKMAREEPFARYEIDSKVEEEYKNKIRFDDPMKKILHKYDKGVMISNDYRERMITRGFILPNCKFAGPPNRFGIQPGFRWDGVNRSTGFEQRYLSSFNTRIAQEQEFHKLRTEDM